MPIDGKTFQADVIKREVDERSKKLSASLDTFVESTVKKYDSAETEFNKQQFEEGLQQEVMKHVGHLGGSVDVIDVVGVKPKVDVDHLQTKLKTHKNSTDMAEKAKIINDLKTEFRQAVSEALSESSWIKYEMDGEKIVPKHIGLKKVEDGKIAQSNHLGMFSVQRKVGYHTERVTLPPSNFGLGESESFHFYPPVVIVGGLIVESGEIVSRDKVGVNEWKVSDRFSGLEGKVAMLTQQLKETTTALNAERERSDRNEKQLSDTIRELQALNTKVDSLNVEVSKRVAYGSPVILDSQKRDGFLEANGSDRTVSVSETKTDLKGRKWTIRNGN